MKNIMALHVHCKRGLAPTIQGFDNHLCVVTFIECNDDQTKLGQQSLPQLSQSRCRKADVTPILPSVRCRPRSKESPSPQRERSTAFSQISVLVKMIGIAFPQFIHS